jgi:hypothetical protein
MSDRRAEPSDAVKAAVAVERYRLIAPDDEACCHECAEQRLRRPRRSVFEAAELLQVGGWVLLIVLVCGVGLCVEFVR